MTSAETLQALSDMFDQLDPSAKIHVALDAATRSVTIVCEDVDEDDFSALAETLNGGHSDGM